MSRVVRFSIVAVVALAACQVVRPAAAQVDQPYGTYWGYGFGAPYNYYQRERINYYSLHPPVYYSHPVARPYGYSPFAYPPGTMTPDAPAGEPMSVTNPYVPQPVVKQTGTDRVTGGPETIVNPYASPERLSAKP